MLLLPKHSIQETPIRTAQSLKIPVTKEINKRTVFVNRCTETQDSQYAFRTERQRNVEAHPKNILAVNFGPVKVHAALTFSFHNKSCIGLRDAHIVFQASARQR